MFGTRLLFPPFLSPDAPAATEPARPAVPPVSAEKRRQSLVDRLISRHGDAESALSFLATTNIAQEDTIESIRSQNDDYKRRLPDGSVVITAAEAKNLEKLRALGTVDEVVKGMADLKTLQSEKADHEARQSAKGLAKTAVADEEAFAEHFLGKHLKSEVRNVETMEHGKKVTRQVLYVQAGEKEPYVAWPEYLAKLPAHEQRALTPVATTPGQSTAAPGAPAPAGVTFPVTPVAPAGGGVDPVSDFMSKRNARVAAQPNPILGRPATTPQAPAPVGAGAS